MYYISMRILVTRFTIGIYIIVVVQLISVYLSEEGRGVAGGGGDSC